MNESQAVELMNTLPLLVGLSSCLSLSELQALDKVNDSTILDDS